MNTHLTPVLRRLAALTAACFSWSFIFAAAAQAATYKAPQPPGHRRLLSGKEMSHIFGATPVSIGGDGSNGNYGSGGGNAGVAAGAARPWEGQFGDVKTGNGNKMTQFPLVGWAARGGLTVSYTLTHNSENTLISGNAAGAKVLSNYDIALTYPNGDPTKINILWGDGSAQTFTWNGSVYAPPPGIHDRLVVNVNGSNTATSYDLTTKDQIRFHITPFTYNNSTYIAATSISDENGNTITINRYVNGALNTIVDPTGRTITIGYSGGHRSSVTDPLGRVWTMGYDGSGNLTQINFPALNGTTYYVQAGYDAANDITSLRDRRGNTSTYAYNIDGSLAWEQDAAGNRTSFGYSGSSTTITDPNGHPIVHTYNAAGQLASVTDARNYTEYYSYDADNNRTQKQDRRGYSWNNTYDGNGNVLTAKDPYTNTTTYTYNAHNKALTVKTQLGRSVAITYDGNDNPTQVQEKDTNSNMLATTNYAYTGGYGLLTSKTDTNQHTTQYGYDANGYLSSVTTPLGHQTQATYDALGFQTSRKDALSRTTNYTPDAWERRVTTTYPDGTTATFGYDPNGNLTAFNNYTANWGRAYDADDRITAEYCNGGLSISYAYDAPGQKGLKGSFTDAVGRTVAYTYTARNELSTVADSGGTTTYGYDPNGNQTAAVLPSGRRQDTYYNNDNTLGHVTSAVTSSGFVFENHGYSYNADDQIVGTNEDTYGNPSTYTSYGYDGQGHLSSAQRTGDSPYYRLYTCDGVGNRTLQGGDNLSGPMTHDADDELTGFSWNNGSTAGTATFGYDANGQRTSETTGITSGFAGYSTQYGYDFDGQLTSITKPGSTTTFRYDPLGRQVSRSVNGTLTGFSFDGGQIVFEEVNGSVTKQYTWGNGLIRCNGEYPLTDGPGNVRHMTDGNGTYLATTQADPFGLTVASSGSSANPYQYNASSGYRSDGDGPADAAPLQKVGARYYDPQFGVFLTRDTDLSQKPYAYCDGDPVNFSDSTGHYAMPVTSQTTSHDALTSAFDAASVGADVTVVDDFLNLSTFRPGATNVVKGTVSGGFNKSGPIDTTTLGVTLQMGRTSVTDTATLIQTPTLTSLKDTVSATYSFGGGASIGVNYTSGTHGTPPSGGVIFNLPFTIR